ncbi:MAG: hypothetical protein F4223_03320 [Rhodobacteraceae bacterium]|nr:hypothetical protein [Paracoccaceae bacterium]
MMLLDLDTASVGHPLHGRSRLRAAPPFTFAGNTRCGNTELPVGQTSRVGPEQSLGIMRELSVSAEMGCDDYGGTEEQDRRCLE